MAGIMAAGITVFGHGFGSSSSKKHLIYEIFNIESIYFSQF